MQTDIALGFAQDGDKQQEGDGKIPVGVFTIDRRNPNGAFHLSLGIDYPRSDNIARAQQEGVDPGGDIFVHWQPNGSVGLTLPQRLGAWVHCPVQCRNGTALVCYPNRDDDRDTPLILVSQQGDRRVRCAVEVKRRAVGSSGATLELVPHFT